MPDDLPTLRLPWLYAQHNLDLRPLVPATPDRGFTVVQPTELTDPGEFLAPQAVVLTVGVALSREHGPFPAYIDRLADAEVTAVGFGTGLFYPRVPPNWSTPPATGVSPCSRSPAAPPSSPSSTPSRQRGPAVPDWTRNT
ncbi:hypothetical protein Csp1_26240 [Corynebacterium provencense]|uniref:Uncharacterized protein n=1 Tax=Corynebacterium provencense TaxID=1737425 RepID=A0A2Z3YZ58_9CORY|nr:hypothetical protein [Corynebacterium provencense]AWT27367.1 hypothetical protein Csp1_26240 [Corynebacterium provencense]